MEYLRGYVESNPDTLVILTADHSTGGLTLGANGEYRWSPKFLENMSASAMTIALGMTKEEKPSEYVATQLGLSLTDEELATLDSVANQDEEARFRAITAFLDTKTNTGWTTSGHTGVDVEVFAFGAGYQSLMGQIDNTDIAKTIFSFIDKKQPQKKKVEAQRAKSNIEFTSDEEKTDSKLCDFKEDWRCN